MTTPRIDRTVEPALRHALDLAMKGKLDELHRHLAGLPTATLQQCVGLCTLITGYTAIDVCGRVWPADRNRDRIARRIADHTTEDPHRYQLSQAQVHDFISRVCLRREPLDHVFNDPDTAAKLPFAVTAHFIAGYAPPEMTVWDFLDRIEAALETAWTINPDILPALMLRNRTAAVHRTPAPSIYPGNRGHRPVLVCQHGHR